MDKLPLSKTPAVEAQADSEEPVLDAFVASKEIGQLGAAIVGVLARVGDDVSKGDLRGQERVGKDIRKSHSLQIRHDERCVAFRWGRCQRGQLPRLAYYASGAIVVRRENRLLPQPRRKRRLSYLQVLGDRKCYGAVEELRYRHL